MSAARHPLEAIEIERPCPVADTEVPAGERSRFCPHCKKYVYNLSAMSRSEAERLACQQAGEMCAQIDKTLAGEIVTLDYQAPPDRQSSLSGLLVPLTVGGIIVMGIGLILPMQRSRGAVRIPRAMTPSAMPATNPSATPPVQDTSDNCPDSSRP